MKLKLISKSCYCLRLIAVLLVVVTVVTLIPKNLTAHAFESASQPDLAGIITAEDAEQYSIVSRDQASEIDLNSFIFNTKNGEKAEFFYPYDVHLNWKAKLKPAGAFSGEKTVGRHWVTITGIEDKTEGRKRTVTLIVSSWGKEYKLDFSDVYYYSSYWAIIYFLW